jgi:seryl-tRNA synthetase
MLDINLIREKPDLVKSAMRDLNTEAPIDEILTLDANRRDYLQEVEALRAERNAVSKEIGRSRDPEERQAKIERMRAVGDRIESLEADLKIVDAELYDAMLQVPNLPGPDVPVGPVKANAGSSTLSQYPIGTWGLPWTSSTLSGGSNYQEPVSSC